MRFNVDRICELAGLGAASGGLISEAAVPPKQAGAPAAKAPPPAPAKKAPAAAPAAPAKDDMQNEYDDGMTIGSTGMSMREEDPGYYDMDQDGLDDGAMYEIDEMDLMEALTTMRQQRLEESSVRDAVRDEIKRALADRSGSWMYGANKPTVSKYGQISRGGFGFGFKK